jgi:Spy/CpxP family protein refolding chaperone
VDVEWGEQAKPITDRQGEEIMTTRTTTLLTLLAVTVLSAGMAMAQAGYGRGYNADSGRGAGFGFDGDDAFGPRMTQVLDLTEAQNVTITDMREAHFAAVTGKRKNMMRLRNELRGLMLQDDVNEDAVLSLTRKIGDLRTELQMARTEMRLKVRDVLTEEQRDKMMMMKNKRGGRGGRGGFDCGSSPRNGDQDGRGRGQRGSGRRI